ncbi:Probable ubiquitin carboxyl-terminal hydrolase FAF-X [Mytilus coruscus]|uniref:Probable ubiquitin carboxyl-terminal hydrolase FAF-X n=1 Tax=Mytilus coruscus TaxID=42192 RepID=A0A6J8EQC4_MYTCO|nr:Probable ubiquitin carboxyl-terminal hydrolase FAF-X [Mytilus coruscus]
MADIDWSDDEQINEFFNDGDSEDDFEGFGPEDLVDINRNILANLPIFDFSPENERDFPEDLGNGWLRRDSDVINAPFTRESKLNNVMQSNEPLDFLKLFITDDFINELVFQTNKFAEVKANDDESLKENSRIKKWQLVTLDEMKVFLSLVIAMGLVKKIYNPAKPTKFGIKLYQVCEASSGYCIGFDVYTGCSQIGEQADLVLGENKCNTTTKVVIGLLSRCGLLDNGHHVYMDNYYVSPELFTELEVLNTYACGTLRKNRLGVPDAIKKTSLKLKRGEVIFRRKEGLLAVKFHDKRDVHMLSTIHPATVSVLNKNDRRTNNPIVKPTSVVDYCSFMGGVDLSDQINQYYSCLRKTSKWYKKLFFYLLNLFVINSFILYKKYAPVNKTRKEHNIFRTSVVNALIQEAVSAPRPQIEMGRKILGEKPTRLLDRHFPNHIPAKGGAKRAHPTRDCVACNYKKSLRQACKRKQTTFWCPTCKVALFLLKDGQLWLCESQARQAVLLSPDDVANEAITLLKDIFTNLGPRLQQNQVDIHDGLIQSCVDRLKALYDTVSVLEKDKDSTNRVMQETSRMVRVLTVLKEYVAECDEAYTDERSILPLSRACDSYCSIS